MAESAVLAHSYSLAAPITRNESHEEKTIHELSESISFGKFMTENLEWGKWSIFSHKKYVEEAEKYSLPGSVAQKKAFFEAHYKRIAQAKETAIQEQPNVTPAQLLLHTLEPQNQDNDDVVVVADELNDEFERKDKENVLICNEENKKKKQEEETRRSITKNRPVFRLSMEKIIPPLSIDTTENEKTSERPKTQSLEMKEESLVHHHQRFSLLNCFMGNAKTQDKNQSKKKRKTKKKSFMCLCLKPKTVSE